ncbi:M48 family metallopeptidase [Granulosicoccus antarcticus]|uniref:M48 family metallopeptidase n=1 Tax=Granulosicoccus antarcticus TaxID=437505 RepID=UPI000B5A3C9A|nr:SprT family zinc-dependent metalloprotease [Granulosicoccus antarcticus]
MAQQIRDQSAELDYELLVSSRARRVSLKIEPGRGLMVTIPKRFARRDVPAVVESHRAWIEKTLDSMQLSVPERFRQWPPESLVLPAIGQVLELSFHASGEHSRLAERSVSGNIGKQIFVPLVAASSDQKKVLAELAVVLKGLARHYLPVRLAMLAEEHGLVFQRTQIRGQRTRWGSCSTTGTISLNYKLLFLSPELVDYVLLHELAHTLHMNHSPDFWRQLQSMHPDARQLDARLKQAGQEVPPWLI